MSQPTGPAEDPFSGIDPEVWEILASDAADGVGADGQGADGQDVPGAGPPPGLTADGPAPPGPRHRAAGWGAAGALVAVLFAAAIADPSGLAAPIAWSGARLAAEPWTWLQYALLGPLMVLLLLWWTRLLLAGAAPAAPRRWVLGRVWLLVVLAAMVSKLAYSVVLLAPALVGGAAEGLPLATSAPYLAWASGFAGIKAGLYGWLPGLVAALLWRPGAARRAGAPTGGSTPSLSLLRAALATLLVALAGRLLADHWWTGSPVGYAHTTDWRLLAPTAAAGNAGQIVALVVLWLLLAASMRATLRWLADPRRVGGRLLAGSAAAVAAGLGLALMQSILALLFGTDLPGGNDLWILPSTYLRLVEGASFGMLLAPVAALAVLVVPRAAQGHWSWIAAVAAVAVVAGTGYLVVRQAGGYDGVPPLAGRAPAPTSLPAQPVAAPTAPAPPAPLTVRRDADGTAVLSDPSGAQVILRGANVNQLGDYYTADPAVAPVLPLAEQDFADMAALGFNAVRLVMSWSLLEPQPGQVDSAYLDRIKLAVGWAGAHGLHVVLDMHQDAWSAGVVAPEGTRCRAGTTPMTGWDGAPAWADRFDGAPPCQLTGRHLAPTVLRAFTSFYTDRVGLLPRLVAVWGRVAREFGGDPTIAGYDLLNEPSFAEQAPVTSGMLLGRFHALAIAAIRAGEAEAPGGYAHPVFLEPSIWWSGFGLDPLPPRGFTDDPQVVLAPHLYGESITVDQSLPVTTVGIERGFALAQRAAAAWGVPLWVGEWGFFGDAAADRPRYERFAAAEDAARVGSAVWVWKQGCGDPRAYPSDQAGNLRRVACPEGTALPSEPDVLEPLARAYPRSAPGRILAIRSEGRRLQVDGDTGGAGPVDGQAQACGLDVWVPGEPEPRVVDSTGVTGVRMTPVPAGSPEQAPSGGWRVTGCAQGVYRLTVS